MYIDIGLNSVYNIDSIDSLESSLFSCFCINHTIDQRDCNKFKDFELPFTLKTKKLFKKITVRLENHNFNNKSLYKKCDVLCLEIKDFSMPVDENVCDIVKIDCTKYHKFKNINPNIYYEIDIVDTLYDKTIRMIWMHNVRELIRITRCKNIVIGTGACTSTELKSPLDIIKMLTIFDISEDKCKRILFNTNKCLEKCAEKRFTKNSCIFNNKPEGDLKCEFLIKKHNLN